MRCSPRMDDWESSPETKAFGSPRTGETQVSTAENADHAKTVLQGQSPNQAPPQHNQAPPQHNQAPPKGERADPLYVPDAAQVAPRTAADPAANLPDYVIADILNYVQHELGKHGAAVRIAYDKGKLHVPQNPDVAAVNISPWASSWEQIDESGRLRRAADAARQLTVKKSVRPPRRQTTVRFSDARDLVARLDLRLVGLIVVLLLCGVAIFFEDFSGSASSSPTRPSESTASEPVKSETTGPSREHRVCAATMSRVFQGGSVSVADVDGWQVEVALLKKGGTEHLDAHPFLKEVVQEPAARGGSKFIWEGEPGLVTVDTSDTLVEVRRTTLGEGNEVVPGVTLTFGGTLVDAYFKEAGRGSYYHIANTLSEKLGATHTAVYAKCFDSELHALGGWFRGLTAQSAAASLVYFMGTYAKPVHVARPYYKLPNDTAINRPHAFKNIDEKTNLISRSDLATLVGNEGGMASGKDGEHVIITFPFRDGNRASRASRNVVRVTSLGR